MPHDERVTRWSFYNYILAIDPDVFARATNEVVCAAMEAEGIPAEVQYPLDEPLRVVPAVAVTPPCGGRVRRPAGPAGDVVPGGRGGRPA